MDQNSNHKLSLLEWLCAHFGKSYADLNDFVDAEARERALAEAMVAGEEAKRAEEEIIKAEQHKELQASLRAAALERESKMVSSMMRNGHHFRNLQFESFFPDRCRRHARFLPQTGGECWGCHEDERAAGTHLQAVERFPPYLILIMHIPLLFLCTDQGGVPAAQSPARSEEQAERGNPGRQPNQVRRGDRARG
jgi:hypothetical protein